MSTSGRWYWFDGRIPRSTYWACVVGMFILWVAIFLLVSALAILTSSVFLPTSLFYIGIVLLIYFVLVVSIKRCHDRNKSAWWVLMSFIPLVGPIWAFVELGCLAGTNGENRYGDDPRRQDNLMAHDRTSQSDSEL